MPIHTLLAKMHVCVSLEAYHIYIHMLCYVYMVTIIKQSCFLIGIYNYQKWGKRISLLLLSTNVNDPWLWGNNLNALATHFLTRQWICLIEVRKRVFWGV